MIKFIAGLKNDPLFGVLIFAVFLNLPMAAMVTYFSFVLIPPLDIFNNLFLNILQGLAVLLSIVSCIFVIGLFGFIFYCKKKKEQRINNQ